MSDLALSASSEYLCYGSTSIINILILSVRGATQTSDSDSKDDPRTVVVKHFQRHESCK